VDAERRRRLGVLAVARELGDRVVRQERQAGDHGAGCRLRRGQCGHDLRAEFFVVVRGRGSQARRGQGGVSRQVEHGVGLGVRIPVGIPNRRLDTFGHRFESRVVGDVDGDRSGSVPDRDRDVVLPGPPVNDDGDSGYD
jgi:hypothetical protein